MYKVERELLAIVGIGCRFPGGATCPESLWQLLRNGVDAIGEVPADRWDHRRFYHPDGAIPGKTYARHGGFLSQSPYELDAPFFGLSTREASTMDPQQRLLLETAWEAMEDAGVDAAAVRGRAVGVFVGGFSLDNLIDRFGVISRDHISPSSATAGTMVMLSNRLSHAFDFIGPSLSVDTACSSSLVATHLACQSVWNGDSEIALAGGVNVMITPEAFIAMAKGGFLSKQGRCAAFDASADGYVRAEGAGIVVIRPLAAALESGDRIYACIVGTGVNHDGHTPGIAMPNPASQQALIRQVLRESGLDGGDITYVEAHGPGTQAGDPVEATSLGTQLARGRSGGDVLWVGSIKTNIGHTEAAAGVAGLIKAALVLHHREVPPNLHFRSANPKIDLPALGLGVPIRLESLPADGLLHAAVNSFGYGGTNAHALLCTPPAPPPPRASAETTEDRLYPLSARDDAALTAFAAAAANTLGSHRVQDVGYSLALRRTHHSVRAAVWAHSAAELGDALRDLEAARSLGRTSLGRAPERPRKLLFVYTGMGAQYVGMGRQLFVHSPVFRAAIERCDALVQAQAKWSLVDLFAGLVDDGPIGAPIGAPAKAQLPNLAMQVGLTELWRSLGIEPQGVVGHSVGEIAAAWAAGVLTLEETLRLACHRGEAFQRLAGQGLMMAIGMGRAAAEDLLGGRGDELSVTAILAPDSVVVGGPRASLDRLAAELAANAAFHSRLHVDVAYHHAQVEALDDEVRQRFGRVEHAPARIPLYSTARGMRLDQPVQDAQYWRQANRAPADFEAAITAALGDGFDAFLDVGPHRVLSAAVKSCAAAAGKAVWAGASIVRGEPELLQVQKTLAEMYVDGVPVRWEAHHYDGCFVRLPAYPWQRARLWTEAPASRASHELAGVDVLLHHRIDGPAPAWQTDVSSTLLPYLPDHVVAGTPLFPGAAHVAVMLAASRALDRGNSVEGVRFERVLALSETTSLQVDVDPATGAISVSARAGREEPWQVHASARLGLVRAPRQVVADIAAARAAVPRHLSAAAVYEGLADRGLTYGPSFRPLRDVWYGDDTVVASLALPANVAPEGPIHPVLLDGAFQALAVLAPQNDGRGPLIPFAVDEVRLHGNVPDECTVVGRVIERTPNSFTASLTICDSDGTTRAEVDRLRCQRLPTADADPLTRATFHDTWEKATVPSPKRTAVQRWTVVDADDGLAAALVREMRSQGHEAHSVSDNGSVEPGVDGVVWLAAATDAGDAGLAAATRLLEVVQQVARWPEPPPRLAIVTRSAFAALPRANQASVWGLGRVVATERPELRVRLVDVENDDRVPAWLAREVLAEPLDREVRLGAEGRLVARVQPWSAPPPPVEAVSVEELPVILRQARAGVPDSLTWHEFRATEPGPGQLEIRTQAAALNFKDVLKTLNMLSAAYLERTFFGDHLGMETAGVVTRVGPGVTGYQPGDEVVVLSPHFASRLTVQTDLVRPRPRPLAPTEAPVFINVITAHYGLVDIGRLQKGEKVLIHLASGGVGQAAVAVARMLGAEIFATAGDEEKRAYLRAQGIRHVFDSRALHFADEILRLTDGEGVDVVLNSLPGEGLRRSWDVLAPYGRFVEIGKRDIEQDAALRMRRFDENRSFAAIDIDRMARDRPVLFQRVLDDAERLLNGSALGTLPITTFPASAVADAFRLMSRAKHVGKVVIDFRGEQVPAVRLAPPRLGADRSYVVTGAFGGFGQALARWMVGEGARYLVLAGRRGADTAAAQALVEELTALGAHVDARALDVSNGDAVAARLAEIRRTGPPIGGVFHAAMVLDDGLLPSLDSRRLASVMRPKALGAFHLDRATAGDPIDHFVLFSSVAQVIGNLGQGAYCAANGFLDGLARRRRAEGRRALSVGWGVLGDAGVAARDGLVAQLERIGIRAITTSQALAALGRLMDSAPASVAFADVDWARWAHHAPMAATPRFSRVVQASADSDRLGAFRRELATHPADTRQSVLEAMVRTALGRVLGTPPDRLPTDRSLDSLGVDSLMAVELSVSVEHEIGVKLSTAVLMQGPTVVTLSNHILKEVLAVDHVDEADVTTLSEAETDALLEQLAASGELDLSQVS